MKIGSLVRTGKGMYAYEGCLAIVVSRQASKAVALRVLSSPVIHRRFVRAGSAQVGDIIYARGFDYDDLEVISESR